MLIDAIGDMLPIATAIALSPFPIIAVVLVVGGPHARTAGLTFTAGVILAIAALSLLSAFIATKIGESGSASGPILSLVRIALGLLLLWAALQQWQKRPRSGDVPDKPKWLAGFSDVKPGRAFTLGVLVCVSNPKVIGLVLAAMSSLAYMQLASIDALLAIIVFVLLCALPVIAIVLAHRFGGEKAAAGIVSVETFMLRNNNVILMVVFIVLGMMVLGKGVAGLNGY